MTKDQKDPVFVLVKSLSKSEKRQFKLYVGRLGINQDSKGVLWLAAWDNRLLEFNPETAELIKHNILPQTNLIIRNVFIDAKESELTPPLLIFVITLSKY